ncbi:hypothetical protein PUNSTDRAFT_97936 [Punctularia strigosozonata HHB-11173 SS5]|uniref:uncharacterized protein n=1 Tax=Punctularia strigosozonata (strain HHB-11173) TaxID=741275 RepID=UPI000441632C|nr:uncharacterized protein PUNSTDRAFT_97936 [Punctularia strigosozonata HHB-11173 SS5]EIN12950.1 hypothetical protein PUNSTDRAFT_97936 [Punctularia strigosozonata HHB-11173 SS5]
MFGRLFLATLALCAAVSAAPTASNETEVLDKRTTHTGQATYFYVGLGACGYTDTDDDAIIAISSDIYGSGGNCNQWIKITNTDNGNVAYGKTRDSCPGCDSTSLDLSPSLFKQLGDLDDGVLPIKWHFMSKEWSN